MSFIGKSALVTGGSSGIGFHSARNLLMQGVTQLSIWDLKCSKEVLQELQAEAPKATIHYQPTDVTNRAEVEASFRAIHDKFGYVDILVNSAGVFDEQNFERTFAANVFGLINATEVACQYMSKANNGRGGIIGNISSTVGLDCIFSKPIYVATKHAVSGYTRCLGHQYYHNIWGINFILICPGITETPFIENINSRLYHKDANEETVKLKANLAVQSAEVCGKMVVDVLNKPNGSIWMLDDGKVKEIVLKNHWLPENY